MIAGYRLEVARVPGGLQLDGHAHDLPHLCLVIEGGFQEDGWSCTPGTLRLSPAGDRHQLRFGRLPSTCLLVFPAPSQVRRWPDGRTFFREARIWRLGQSVVAEAEGDEPDTIGLEAVLAELLSAAARLDTRGDRRPPAWLRRVRERLDECFASGLSLTALAAESGVAREHVARAFRAHYGMAMGEYLRNRRLRFVHERLLVADQPLADIALQAGFADQSHLTRWFRRALGVTPGAARRRARP